MPIKSLIRIIRENCKYRLEKISFTILSSVNLLENTIQMTTKRVRQIPYATGFNSPGWVKFAVHDEKILTPIPGSPAPVKIFFQNVARLADSIQNPPGSHAAMYGKWHLILPGRICGKTPKRPAPSGFSAPGPGVTIVQSCFSGNSRH